MKWTKNQEEAINIKGINTIVSAGAGSGKTAVLTERVIQKLLNKTHINELLLLTFTNNAAYEMKNRIKKEILKHPEIQEEIKLVESADITTFDAFALSLVKKYHYYLNLSKDINIIDASIINKKKKDYINEIFNDLYEDNNPDFISFVTTFGTKNDKQIKKLLLEINQKTNLLSNEEEYLNNYITSYYSDSNINELFKDYENNIISNINTINNLLYNLSFEVDNDYYNKIYKELKPLLNSNTYEEIKINVLNIDLPRITGSTDKGKYYKKEINNIVNNLKDITIYSKDMLINNLLSTKKYANIIINILIKLNEKTNNFKNKYSVYEFNDISKLAIKLVKEYEDVRSYLKYHYKEILIDEYQDTSDIEEEFINIISNNNLYMVGDIKQSIYRFRNANPDIFKLKYEQYKNNIDGYKIDLNENFRSRKEVLDSINIIFNHIMDLNIGNANYKDEHQLIFGNNTYINEGNNNYNNYLDIYSYDDKDTSYNKNEIEAFIIASDIIDKINNKYLVYDNTLRPCTYKDFCILQDRSADFDVYKKVFNYLNIPLNIYKDEDILMTDELLLINNIISLIINIKNNIKDNNLYYASIARSYLFNIKDEEIYNTITNNKIANTNIYKICKDISKEIDYLNNKEILSLIINRFDFYNKMITTNNTLKRTITLENLLNKFNELDKVDINIYNLNDYLNSLIEDKESIKVPGIINEDDKVTITTIHKSKGLEYKICYYSGLYKEFNKMDVNKRIIINSNYGLILPAYDEGFIDTFVKTLNKNKYNLDEISEKIRLLYVALTRAKEKIILVAPLKEDIINIYDENNIVDHESRLKYKSFLDILNSVNIYIDKYITKKEIPNINPNYIFNKEIDLNKINKSDKIIVNEIEYISNIVNQSHYSKANTGLYTKEEINNINLGTKMHYILEHLDFINPNLDLYTKEEGDIINSLLSNLNNLKECTIYKEHEYIYEKDNNYKHGIIDLILEYKDHYDIIDYKLKNTTDKAYISQLNGYKEYLSSITKKEVNTYLYSLLDKELINIK